jgi:Fe-S-cluster containining protein
MTKDERLMSADSFAHDVIRGLVYAHNRANANTAEVHQACATMHAVVELLIEGGVLDHEALEARRQEAARQLRRQYLAQGMAVAMQEFGTSKYEFQNGAEVDCQNRVHLCKAACCRIPLALSREDVQEGLVRWDLGQPYIIARDGDGYCVHLDRETYGCTVYAQRPIPCRGYDCREDERIWLDFENKVVNARIDEPDWPECIETEAVTVAGGEG